MSNRRSQSPVAERRKADEVFFNELKKFVASYHRYLEMRDSDHLDSDDDKSNHTGDVRRSKKPKRPKQCTVATDELLCLKNAGT